MVLNEKVLVLPETPGFVIFVNTKLFAPATDEVPVLRVTVTTWLETETVKVPSIPEGVPVTAVAAPELKVNPAGNVTTILPLEGIALDVVKATVTLPAAPATRDTKVMLVDERLPAVIVTAAAVPSSILTSLAS